MSTSPTLKRKLSTSLTTATSNTATAIPIASSSSSSCASSSPRAPKRICLHDNAAASTSTSSVTDEDVVDHDDEDDNDLWALMEPEVWDKLGGAHDERKFAWSHEQNDLIKLFGMSFEEEY